MSKRITAAQAFNAAVSTMDFSTKHEADRMNHVIKMTKLIRTRRPSVSFAKAAQIAKRAYRMGVRAI